MSVFDPLQTLAVRGSIALEVRAAMTRSTLLSAILIGCCASASVAHPASLASTVQRTLTKAQREPLDAVNAFFAAVEANRHEQVLAAVVPEGLATLVRLHDGKSPTLVSWHWASYVEEVLSGGGNYRERIFNPEVLVERDMAMVWGRFAVYADGKFSHCGVDQFQLVRKNGRWLIYNLTWTSQSTGCPTPAG